MSLIGSKQKAGGFMDEIRCDEESYLIWKWHPYNSEAGNNKRENAIRWGSSLRVRDGSVAVFVYKQDNGTMQDFIEGPFDETIKTKNFPVLASIVGLAYEGGTPFQAEVYFINLAEVIQIKFAIPYFDIYDPRFLDFSVPTAVRGTLTFKIKDYKEFIKLHRLDNFSLDNFKDQVKDAITRYVKSTVTNIPAEHNIPVIQLERKISEITEKVEPELSERLNEKFGVTLSGFDISAIETDKTSDGYLQLKAVTQDVATATVQAQANANIKNIEDMQRINAENMEETLRAQREEAQYAQHKQTQSGNMEAYKLEQQAAVGIAGAEALGNMGSSAGMDMSGGGGMNPAGMMAGMAIGGAVGQNIAGTMNNMMNGVNNPAANQQNDVPQNMTPPPINPAAYHVAVNGQSSGPFDMNTLSQKVSDGSFTQSSLVWKQGMNEWMEAGKVQELQSLFNSNTNTPPPVPNM